MPRKKPLKQKAPETKPELKEHPPMFTQRQQHFILLGIVLVVTFFCYSHALTNHFTNWDDNVYIKEDSLIKNLSSQNIEKMFDHKTAVSLNYHPLTILSLALNYHFSGMQPRSYYLTNIFLHLLNTLLVFCFVYFLFDRKYFIAILSATWFGIHPMHVESVAWIAERKDVLYTLFFMGACIVYLKYLKKQELKYLILTFILFMLSCLSKGMAVVLPVILLLIDYFKSRKYSTKMLVEKVPFFIVSILIGINAVLLQSHVAINKFSTFSVPERFMFASYGFVMYIVKLILPVHLSAFYPYPHLNTSGTVPFIFYLMPLFALLIAGIPIAAAWFYNKKHLKVVIFGLAFYFVTVALVLQFISVGSAIMADRYSYISYIGLFIILAYFAWIIKEKLSADKRPIVTGTVLVLSLGLAYLCKERVKVWHNTKTLWEDVIAKYPLRVETAYKNLGNFYAQSNHFNKAEKYYNTLVALKSKDPGVYTNLGNIYGLKNDLPNALKAYTHALQLDSGSFDTYLNMAVTYSRMKRYPEALANYQKAAKYKPNNHKLIENRAYTYLAAGHYKKSIADYDHLLRNNPGNALYYFFRGFSKYNLKDTNGAIADFKTCLRVNPKYASAYYNLSVIYNSNNQHQLALENALQAQKYGYKVSPSFLNKLKKLAGKQ